MVLHAGAAGERVGGVHGYRSLPASFSTVNWFLPGTTGSVMIDTQFLPSAARESMQLAESLTGKAVTSAIVLHPNPDKFNGTETLQRAGIEVLTSAQVLAEIPAVHEQRSAKFRDRYAPDYPAHTPAPKSFGDATTELELAGAKLRCHVLGPGCSRAHVVVDWDGHVFVGDLVTPGAHAWLELGLVGEWLARLDEIAAMKPRYVLVGRGHAAGPELLDQQRVYLEHAREAVAAENPKGEPDDAAIARAKAKIVAKYPDHGFDVFLDFGLPALWRNLAAATSAPSEPASAP